MSTSKRAAVFKDGSSLFAVTNTTKPLVACHKLQRNTSVTRVVCNTILLKRKHLVGYVRAQAQMFARCAALRAWRHHHIEYSETSASADAYAITEES